MTAAAPGSEAATLRWLRTGLLLAPLALSACNSGDSSRDIGALAKASVASAPSPLMDAAFPPTDLPPPGTRSLFDHLIKENGSLPYPFEKLAALVQAQDAKNQPSVGVLIPDGRSLLKAFADFESPRVLVGATAQPPAAARDLGTIYRGRLFLGFVEKAAEIEVISYNEAAGRFEFQLVKNYCEGCVPRIVYAKRAICTTCHVGQGPIFPQRPWEETNGQGAIAQHLVSARKARSVDHFQGVPLTQTLAQPEAFDDLTDIGNAIPVMQRIWIEGCGPDSAEGSECRRLLLKSAIRVLMDPASFDKEGKDVKRLRELQAKVWPAGGIALDNNDLFNRNPLKDPGVETGFWDKLREIFRTRDHVRTAETPNSEAGLAEFESLPRLRPEFDPLSRRVPKKMLQAGDPDAIYGLARLFAPGDKAWLEKASGHNPEWLGLALKGAAVSSQLKPVPFQRSAILLALLKDMQSPVMPDAGWIDATEMSPPIADGAPPLAVNAESPLKPFETYCFACHRGNPSAKLDFMNGATEDEVLARIKDKTEIVEALDYARYRGTDKENKLMPPADSYQRRQLDAAVAAGGKEVQQMTETIPSLF